MSWGAGRWKRTPEEICEEWTKERLVEIQCELGLTVERVSKATGYSVSYIRQMRVGEARITPKFVKALMSAVASMKQT